MRYPEFENILSPARMNRYLNACNGQTKKAMTLYRLNLTLSQEMFTIIGCFEVALRNAIDKQCRIKLGHDWLMNGAKTGGIFDNEYCRVTAGLIADAISKIRSHYTHDKLVAQLGFGFWRYMFAPYQFRVTGRNLVKIFPAKPISSELNQINHTYIFNELGTINQLRNRIAHHEPICFKNKESIKSTADVKINYNTICKLLEWMTIDPPSLLYGLNHILTTCNKIDIL